MRWPTIFMTTFWLLLAGHVASAGTIYTWTDADGVRRYSNAQPPEGVENVRTLDEVEYEGGAEDDSRRREFERMVEEASEEADRHFDQQARQKARQDAQRKQSEKQARNQLTAEEKARLMNEIEALQNRALGPNFTQGMRENLIRQLREKLDQLEAKSTE